MMNIKINSNLTGFLLLDEITDIQPDGIRGTRRFEDSPVYLGIESLAQLGAMHVRYLTGFGCHAFLLKISHCRLPAAPRLTGGFTLGATLENHSRRSFAYTVAARQDDSPRMDGTFLFATVDYGETFRKERLQTHYRKIFSCLYNASKND